MKLINKISRIISPYIICIPTYKRNIIIFNRTLKTLYECNFNSSNIYLFLASDIEYNDYYKEFKIISNPIFNKWLSKINCVIGLKGLKNQRNFISQFFLEKQNIIQMDDDILDFYQLNINHIEPNNKSKWYLKTFKTNSNIYENKINNLKNKKTKTKSLLSKVNRKSNTKIKSKRKTNIKTNKKSKLKLNDKNNKLSGIFINAFKRCKKEGIYLWGIYPVENAYFMSMKETIDLRFIVGPCFGIINRHKKDLLLTLDEKENVERTLQYWVSDGKVLRLNYITLRTYYYKTPGGMQHSLKKQSARKEHAMTSAEILHKRYPNITKLYIGKKSGYPELKLKS